MKIQHMNKLNSIITEKHKINLLLRRIQDKYDTWQPIQLQRLHTSSHLNPKQQRL
ncbi:hypothetical protein Hanom_Chr07g00658851 [Helianthus anomalus]